MQSVSYIQVQPLNELLGPLFSHVEVGIWLDHGHRAEALERDHQRANEDVGCSATHATLISTNRVSRVPSAIQLKTRC